MSHTHGKRALLLIATLSISLLGNACFFGSKKAAVPATDTSAEPDKILYDRAEADMQKGRFTEARLNFQTLINTYPDSEYLAKAKLAIADSYYKEGGTAGLTQAVAEYKDFITFFPFLDEAPYAQMQVAMAHYRLLEKPDRDPTEARSAEEEFQAFLLKYPNSPLVPQAQQHLREVQEQIAEADFRVARFYYLKRDYRASAARLIDLTERYPLYSRSDQALFMLGDIYDKAEKRDIADRFYAKIVRDYPLSPLAGSAKAKLVAAGVPVPQPDPGAMARMREQQQQAHGRVSTLLTHATSVLHTAPDLSSAARSGQPNLTPSGDEISATDVLHPGTQDPGAIAAVGSSTSVGAGTSGVSVETVPGSAPGTGVPVGEATAPANDSSVPTATTGGTETALPAPPANGSGTPATGAAAPAGAESSTANTSTNSATKTAATNTTGTAAQPTPADKLDPKTESSSKHKKGWHKLIPW
jgi:outer membrane protein assembly factor BamD